MQLVPFAARGANVFRPLDSSVGPVVAETSNQLDEITQAHNSPTPSQDPLEFVAAPDHSDNEVENAVSSLVRLNGPILCLG